MSTYSQGARDDAKQRTNNHVALWYRLAAAEVGIDAVLATSMCFIAAHGHPQQLEE